jgi:hypothetical protein
MERRVSKCNVRAAALCLAAGLALSCGKGISDGRGEVFAFSTADPTNGARIELGEATLNIYPGDVDQPRTIALRRYNEVIPSGAVGPVFEIALPTSDSLVAEGRLDIRVPAEVLAAPAGSYVMGFLVPSGLPIGWQWIPTTSKTYSDCPATSICGAVQTQSFTEPAGDKALASSVLRMAIIKRCPNGIGDCGSLRTCQADICQQCNNPTFCNP